MDLEMDNQNNFKYRNVAKAIANPPIKTNFSVIDYILKLKLAKDAAGANKVAVVVAIIFFIVSIFVFAHFVFGFKIIGAEKEPAPVNILDRMPEEILRKMPEGMKRNLSGDNNNI